MEHLISPTFLFSCSEFPEVRTKIEYCNMMAHARSVHSRYSVFIDDSFSEGGKVCARFRVEGLRTGGAATGVLSHETAVFGVFLVEHGKVEEFYLMAQPIGLTQSEPVGQAAPAPAAVGSSASQVGSVYSPAVNVNGNANNSSLLGPADGAQASPARSLFRSFTATGHGSLASSEMAVLPAVIPMTARAANTDPAAAPAQPPQAAPAVVPLAAGTVGVQFTTQPQYSPFQGFYHPVQLHQGYGGGYISQHQGYWPAPQQSSVQQFYRGTSHYTPNFYY